MSKLITLTHEQLDEFAHSVGTVVATKVLARLEAAGRLKPQAATTTTIGPLIVDFAGHEASVDGTRLVLQPREFRLLAVLAQHVGQVLSREVLLELAYPDPGAVIDRVIDVRISHLRKALGTHSNMIETVLGAGYKLVRPAPK